MPIGEKVKLGKDITIHNPELVNIYGNVEIGDNTKIGAFVEIQDGVKIGKNCKIQSHAFICSGVTMQDNVFVGHNVTFTNDRYPSAVDEKGELQTQKNWTILKTNVKRGASIGSGATILPCTIGYESFVGAGAVVVKDVRDYALVLGVPAHTQKYIGSK